MARILVIDDEKSLRQTIGAVLKYAGYEVMDAPDAFVGIEIAQKESPDLIISDIVMPGMDGYHLLEALREDPQTAAIPVIFISALAERQAIRQGMSLGADDFLVKPFAPDELLEAINTRLKRQATIAEQHDSALKALRKNIIYALPHEMRTPLHLILGFAQMLEMYPEGLKTDDVLQASGAIIQAGQRLERLIENYLVYAQMEVIAMDPDEVRTLREHETCDAADVIDTAARERAEVYHRPDDLRLDVETTCLHIAEESLKKIVQETVDNAFKFSEAGSPVCVQVRVEDDDFIFTVCDKGRGMTSDQIKSVGAYMQFERAFHEQQGLGLGLYIVRRLAELHGGHMHIESAPKDGTQVRITIPI